MTAHSKALVAVIKNCVALVTEIKDCIKNIEIRRMRSILGSVTRALISSSKMSTTSTDGPMTIHLRQKLEQFFNPIHLEVECESQYHNVTPGTEIHFRVQIVSDKFDGLTQLQRQRMVNKVLDEELKTKIHALRIEAKKPSEFSGEEQAAAPKCRGGDGGTRNQ